MTARRPAVDAEFMLHANHIHVRDVQEIRRAQIRRLVLLRNLKAHLRRIIVTAREIINWNDETLQHQKLRRHRATQVRRERGDAAFPWQIIAEERDFADGRRVRHESMVAQTNLPMLTIRRMRHATTSTKNLFWHPGYPTCFSNNFCR